MGTVPKIPVVTPPQPDKAQEFASHQAERGGNFKLQLSAASKAQANAPLTSPINGTDGEQTAIYWGQPFNSLPASAYVSPPVRSPQEIAAQVAAELMQGDKQKAVAAKPVKDKAIVSGAPSTSARSSVSAAPSSLKSDSITTMPSVTVEPAKTASSTSAVTKSVASFTSLSSAVSASIPPRTLTPVAAPQTTLSPVIVTSNQASMAPAAVISTPVTIPAPVVTMLAQPSPPATPITPVNTTPPPVVPPPQQPAVPVTIGAGGLTPSGGAGSVVNSGLGGPNKSEPNNQINTHVTTPTYTPSTPLYVGGANAPMNGNVPNNYYVPLTPAPAAPPTLSKPGSYVEPSPLNDAGKVANFNAMPEELSPFYAMTSPEQRNELVNWLSKDNFLMSAFNLLESFGTGKVGDRNFFGVLKGMANKPSMLDDGMMSFLETLSPQARQGFIELEKYREA